MSAEPFSSVAKSPPAAASAARPVQPVQVWAWIGVFLLFVEFYFGIKWVMSEHFVAVPVGPDLPPHWMRMAMDVGQVVMPIAWCLTFFWFVVRPWWRERRLTTDGLIVIGCTLASGWDALSNTGQYWFTYNSYLVNRGSILAVMPTTVSPHAPGAADAWPMLFINTLYGNLLLAAILLCAVLRFVKARWPQISTPLLLAICLVLGAMADLVVEGLVLLPLGFWSYAGGVWPIINAGEYYKFPLNEAVFAGLMFASLAAMRFFVDDKGQTFFERGLDKVVASPLRKSITRACAVLGGVISIFLVGYHLPQGFIALHSTEWPADVQNLSYFNEHICGPQVNLACPGPNTPIARQGAPRLDFSGHFTQRQ